MPVTIKPQPKEVKRYTFDGTFDVPVAIDDLTIAAGHDPDNTRILHVMVHSDDEKANAAFYQRMANDFIASFYEPLRRETTSDGTQNPMQLPEVGRRAAEWQAILRDSLNAGLKFYDEGPPPSTPTCSPLGITLDPEYPRDLKAQSPDYGQILFLGIIPLLHL